MVHNSGFSQGEDMSKILECFWPGEGKFPKNCSALRPITGLSVTQSIRHTIQIYKYIQIYTNMYKYIQIYTNTSWDELSSHQAETVSLNLSLSQDCIILPQIIFKIRAELVQFTQRQTLRHTHYECRSSLCLSWNIRWVGKLQGWARLTLYPFLIP